jgi:hypothetical protein
LKAAATSTLALLLVVASPAARAETRRLAVVVGNNAGYGEYAPLHYAEADAGKLSQTLVELGGVDPADLFLLQGRSLAALKEVLELAKNKVVAWHKIPDTRVVLIFYFSGHSDGESLEVGRDRLAFGQLRRWLSSTGAEVRVAIVDTCKSGALLAVKGGTPGPAFQIRLNDDLASSGEALLTSSAADELALESREIRGSFFTHHLVSGLRGAADTSGDGNVTLAEAYQYAFAHTVSATAGTLIGPQHPAYDYRLSGQGELVLSALARPTASLRLPPGFDRVLVVQLLRDQVLAELPPGAAVRVAVPPGDYAVRAWRGGQSFAARVSVLPGETRIVRREELALASTSAARAKGGDAPPSPASAAAPASLVVAAPALPRSRAALFVAGGVQDGVAGSVSVLGSLRLGVRAPTPSGWAVAVDISSGRGVGFWETSALALGGYRLGFERRRFTGFAGLEAGVGLVAQNLDGGSSRMSATVVGAPWLGGAVRLTARLSIAFEGHLPVGWIRRDGGDAVVLLPAGWLGLLVRL